jgi:hypothetical protein
MNTSHTAPGQVYPAGCHAQANRAANPPGFGPGSPNTFDHERDARLVESLLTLIEFVGNAKNSKTRVVASILVALWDEDRAVPCLQWVGMLDRVTFEHLINVIRLAATGMPLDRHLNGGPEAFEGMVRRYGFRRTFP